MRKTALIGTSTWAKLGTIALLLAVLAGCSNQDAGPSPSATPPALDDGVPADAAGTPRDAAVSATCAAVSILLTSLSNAQAELLAGAIDESQHAAVVNSVAAGFESLLASGQSQRGLREELSGIVDYIEDFPQTPAGARFAYDDTFGGLVAPVREKCETNQSELVTYMTSGG